MRGIFGAAVIVTLASAEERPLATLPLILQVRFYLCVFALNSPFAYDASSVLQAPVGPPSIAVEQRPVSTTAEPLEN